MGIPYYGNFVRTDGFKNFLRLELEGVVGKAALEIVQDFRKVKKAIMNKLRTTGRGYSGVDSLVIAALEIPDEPTRGPPAVPSVVLVCDMPPEPACLVFNTSSDIAEPVLPMSGIEKYFGSDVPLSPVSVFHPEPLSITAVDAAFEKNAIAVDEIPSPRSLGEALRAENIERAVEERYRCKVCFNRQIEVIFLPCGHLTSCSTCVLNLAKCPTCGRDIRGIANAYLP